MRILLPLLLFICIAGCSKTETETINVTSIYLTDSNNQSLGYTGDTSGQWQQTEFSSNELSLFQSLDTAKLSSSSVPTISKTGRAFPNPSLSTFRINPSATQSYSGTITVKLVIVNSHFQVQTKRTSKVVFSSGSSIDFATDVSNLATGYYRVYITFSVIGSNHFVKFWGNVQKR